MKVVADESVDFAIVEKLRDEGVEISEKLSLVWIAVQDNFEEMLDKFSVLDERRLRIKTVKK